MDIWLLDNVLLATHVCDVSFFRGKIRKSHSTTDGTINDIKEAHEDGAAHHCSEVFTHANHHSGGDCVLCFQSQFTARSTSHYTMELQVC